MWFAGAVLEAFEAFVFVAAFPFVVRLTADAVVAACRGNAATDLLDVA